MKSFQQATSAAAAELHPTKRVLNAGSGAQSARQLHPLFAGQRWEQVRLDIDPGAMPNVVGSITDMREHVPTGSFDAVWCSHTLEHLFAHEVPLAISEFRRILKQDGFVLIRSPDLEAIASLIVERGTECVAYQSPAGPITPLDVLFGHSASIARGKVHMGHKTGFTSARMGRLLLDAGFPDVFVKPENLELWALALMQNSDQKKILDELFRAGLDLFDATA